MLDESAGFKRITANPPYYIKVALISLIESIFVQDEVFVGLPNDYKIVYKDDGSGEMADNTGMIVADVFTDDLIKTDMRPLVVVKRSAMTFSGMSLGDTLNGHGFGASDGVAKYLDKLNVTMIISVYARNDVECETIAWICGLYLKTFKFIIRKLYDFEFIYPPTVSEAMPRRSDSEIDHYQSDVTIPLALPFSWGVRMTEFEHQIKEISVRKFLGGSKPICQDDDLLIPNDPSDNPCLAKNDEEN